MRKNIIILLAPLVCLVLAFTGTAQAQSLCDTATVTPSQGPPGTPVAVHVDAILVGADEAPAGAQTVTVLWDGNLILSIPEGPMGDYDGSFTVPSDAMAGQHAVTVNISAVQEQCPFTFTVTTTVQQQAYGETAITRMPSTGYMALLPALALAAGASGLLLIRKRG